MKVAMISGGGRGLGAAITRKLLGTCPYIPGPFSLPSRGARGSSMFRLHGSQGS